MLKHSSYLLRIQRSMQFLAQVPRYKYCQRYPQGQWPLPWHRELFSSYATSDARQFGGAIHTIYPCAFMLISRFFFSHAVIYMKRWINLCSAFSTKDKTYWFEVSFPHWSLNQQLSCAGCSIRLKSSLLEHHYPADMSLLGNETLPRY